jgi:hypothetical protein
VSTTHDELAYAVATEAVAAIRRADAPWQAVFSVACHVTTSRQWPVPDFVLADEKNDLSAAAEFKPPGQTKREYLTGLGQAVAYTKDFDYGLLVVPDIADDGYPIARHIREILDQSDYSGTPVALLRYDPSTITAMHAGASVSRFFQVRGSRPPHRAKLDASFYAKWREISDEEAATFLRHLYREQTDPSSADGTIRDRAWERVWADIQAGKLHNWQGKVRHFKDDRSSDRKNYDGNMKNWRNFLNHIGWIETDGRLTPLGLEAHHVALAYGARSSMFRNIVARSVLLEGKHLILINAINEYQDERLRTGPFADEQSWLDGIEENLEDRGLLQRNPARHEAATRGQTRGFLKSEKQLWKELGFIIPKGRYVYHQGRGFIFNWSRITELLR